MLLLQQPKEKQNLLKAINIHIKPSPVYGDPKDGHQ